MSASPRLSLSYIATGQAQKETTHNDALNDLDSLAQISVINMTTATPPGSPAEGDSYIIASGATGAWSGNTGKIASYYSGWRIKTPKEGWVVWVQNVDRGYVFDGTNWVLSNLAAPASGYLNFGTTFGSGGYGVRDNAGSIEYKNSGGSWAALSGGGGGGATSFAAGSAASPGWAVTTDTDTGLFSPAANTLSLAAGGIESARFNTATSAVNYLSLTPSATTAAVVLSSAGSDTNIPISIAPKGSGGITLANAITLSALNSAGVVTTNSSGVLATNSTLPAGQFPALTGDITTSSGSLTTAIGAGKVTNTMLAGSIDLTAKVTGILPAANGGTANGFTAFSGPASSTKTFTLPNASDTVACLGQAQTWTAAQSFNSSNLLLKGATSGTITLNASATAGSNTLTLPAATDTLVGKATTDTLTNKTISGSSNTLSNIGNAALTNSSVTIGSTSVSLGATTATVAGLTLTAPVISSISNTGTLTLPTSTDTLVGKATTDTLTNKTFDTAGSGNVFRLNGTQLTTVPQFQSALMIQSFPQGRLTLSSGNSVMNADATAQGTVYYAPHNGAYIPLYDGTQVALKQFTSSTTDAVGLSLALDSTSGHTGYHQSGKLFDLFVANDSGTLRLVTGPAWSSSTSRGTGAGTTELQRFMGFWTNKNSMTARFGSSSGNTITVAANQGTYVGTLYATADGQTGMAFKPSAASGGANNFLALYNAFNRVNVNAQCADSTVSYTGYTSTSVRAANASNSNRISFIDGLQQSPLSARYFSTINSASYNPVQSGVGLDSTSAFSGVAAYYQVALTQTVMASDSFSPQLGLHFVQALETGQSGVTWFGNGVEGLQVTLEM